MRAIGVWVLSVLVGFLSQGSGAGERLTWMSAVQALGFAAMAIESFVHNRLLRLPDCGTAVRVVDERGILVDHEAASTTREPLASVKWAATED
jgi:hypothetical protein